jgi:hypothetical protein
MEKIFKDIVNLVELRLMGAAASEVTLSLSTVPKAEGVPGNPAEYTWFLTARVGDSDSGFAGTGDTVEEAAQSLRTLLIAAHAAVDTRRAETLARINE